jgi:hypothetical protein
MHKVQLIGGTQEGRIMTPEEFTTLKNERDTDPLGLGLPGCGPEVLVQKLNADGSASVETWVVSDTPRTVPKSEVLALLSFDEIVAFKNWREAQADVYARASKELWDSFTSPDMAHPKMRQMVQLLRSLGIIQTDAGMTTILRLGERLKSRAEELIGRKITLEEAQEVIYG